MEQPPGPGPDLARRDVDAEWDLASGEQPSEPIEIRRELVVETAALQGELRIGSVLDLRFSYQGRGSRSWLLPVIGALVLAAALIVAVTGGAPAP